MGSGCIDPHFLDLSTSWRWVVSFTSQLLYLRGKSPRYPLDRRLGGPRNQSGCCEEEKILDPTSTWKSNPSVVQTVASPYTVCAIPSCGILWIKYVWDYIVIWYRHILLHHHWKVARFYYQHMMGTRVTGLKISLSTVDITSIRLSTEGMTSSKMF
jgi:hypothetical protein